MREGKRLDERKERNRARVERRVARKVEGVEREAYQELLEGRGNIIGAMRNVRVSDDQGQLRAGEVREGEKGSSIEELAVVGSLATVPERTEVVFGGLRGLGEDKPDGQNPDHGGATCHGTPQQMQGARPMVGQFLQAGGQPGLKAIFTC